MIRSRMKRLRLDKEEQEGRKLTYEVMAKETGLSKGVIVRLMNSHFERVVTPTLDALCHYFACGVGDLLEYVPNVQTNEEKKTVSTN